jgi:hypothetical protein
VNRSDIRKLIIESVQEVLKEHVLNARTTQEKLKFVDQVLPLMVKSYRYAGGYKGIETEQGMRDELIKLANDPDMFWKMSRRGKDVVAIAIVQRTEFGLKRVMGASSGREGSKPTQGLIDLIRIIKDDLLLKRTYAEVSGAAEAMANRMGWKKVPVSEVPQFLPGKTIIPVDEFHYKREIKGKTFTKVMIGFPTKYKEKIESSLNK